MSANIGRKKNITGRRNVRNHPENSDCHYTVVVWGSRSDDEPSFNTHIVHAPGRRYVGLVRPNHEGVVVTPRERGE